MNLPFQAGLRPTGEQVGFDLTALPHLLVAGTTGSGKSVFMNSLLVDLIRSRSPKELRLLLIDPKRVEFSRYRGSPHLLATPAVTPRDAMSMLTWARSQMENRYRLLERAEARSIEDYNSVNVALPYIVIFIDELANLILVDKNFEEPLVAIASMGRAAGIHLVAATQRPSADVLTGLLRANVPARAAFATVTAMDSRIILDQSGAEKLKGKGDMLFRHGLELHRLQGRFLSDNEIEKAVAA